MHFTLSLWQISLLITNHKLANSRLIAHSFSSSVSTIIIVIFIHSLWLTIVLSSVFIYSCRWHILHLATPWLIRKLIFFFIIWSVLQLSYVAHMLIASDQPSSECVSHGLSLALPISYLSYFLPYYLATIFCLELHHKNHVHEMFAILTLSIQTLSFKFV